MPAVSVVPRRRRVGIRRITLGGSGISSSLTCGPNTPSGLDATSVQKSFSRPGRVGRRPGSKAGRNDRLRLPEPQEDNIAQALVEVAIQRAVLALI
jgi:hypothetical protein